VNKKLIAVAGGIAVVVLAGWWFVLWGPAGDAVTAAETRFRNAKGQTTQLEVHRDRLLAIQKELPQMQSRLQTLSAAVPDRAAMSDFLLAASEAEADSGLDFLTVSASPPTPTLTPGLSTVSVQLTGTGGYFQMLDFINRLQSMHRVMVIKNLTVVANQFSEEAELLGPPNLSVTISGDLFVATLDPEAGAV
jgi:Tfp pilus assembly protein PilO